jgi:tripartite-type tricarboxylate transporter receptor subunit TctC
MQRITKFLLILAAISLLLISCQRRDRQLTDYGWNPTRPVQIIVPWGAGGATDLITRVTAAELEKELGVRFVISNQPGASGSTGTKSALDAARDGYTWTAGSAADLALYNVNGMLDTDIRDDWYIFLSMMSVGIIGVNANSPYQTFDDLMADFIARPGQIGVSTAGLTSSGTRNIETLRRFTGIEFRNIPYDGGNPAVTAVVAGEVQVTSQLASEQADMIRGGRIRPLAILLADDFELSGFGTIPSITRYVPEFSAGANYFGIFIPKGVPENVITAVTRIWDEVIANSEELNKFADERGMVFNPSCGEEAQNRAFAYYQPAAWLFYDGGHARISPDTVGIPRP